MPRPKIKRVVGPPEKRFWAHVDKSGDCWVWTASLDGRGYGQFNLGGGRIEKAHRVSFLLAHGRAASGVVMHMCDNPVCVRPEHLMEGTQADNLADMHAKGRGVTLRGSRNPLAKLDEGKVRRLRYMYGTGLFSYRQLASCYGVSSATIKLAISGKQWRHVDG